MGRQRNKTREHQYESGTYLSIQERIAGNCRRLRESAGWTQEEAAHNIGLSTRLLQRAEACDANLTLTTIARLCHGYEVDISELVAWRRRGKSRAHR